MAILHLLRRRFPIRITDPARNPSSEKTIRFFASEVRRIEKILVANRGEIAMRIMRSSRRLGIRTVAVYSDADKDSLHVKFADEAVRIGPPPPKFSYLDASKIIDAALRTGSQVLCFRIFCYNFVFLMLRNCAFLGEGGRDDVFLWSF